MSKTTRVKRSLFAFLAIAGLFAVGLVWRATRTPEAGEFVQARAPALGGSTELEPSKGTERSGGRRESAVPEQDAVLLSHPANPGATEPGETGAQARFVDEGGAPLAGVELRLASAPAFVAVSGSEGFARLELAAELFVGAARTIVFEAHCRGFARDRRTATARPSQQLLLGDWVLVPAGSVAGIVVDENGSGLAEVQVACLRNDLDEASWSQERRSDLGGLWRPAARAETTADGSFVLEDAPAGRIRLVAVNDERPAGRSDFVDVPAGGSARGVEIRMEAADGGTTIAGIVLDPAGTAVARAVLRVTASGASYSITADEEGRFRLHLNDRKACDVTAQDPERRYREATHRGVLPGTTELVLQLAPAPAIELTVRSSGGAPIERFAAAAIAERDAEVLVFLPEEERPEGLVTLAAPAQGFRIEVRANGWKPARLGPFSADAPPPRLECRLDPAGGVHGVVEAEGEPVVGAMVGLYEATKTNDTYNGFPLRMQASAAIETESEERGVFSLSVEEAGTYYLRAEADGYALAELGPLELSPASQREERIQLGPGGTLEVRVRSPEGASVAGSLVAISRGDGRARTERADERGLVVFPRLTPGGWQVALSETEVDPDYGATYIGTQPAGPSPTNCRVFDGETTHVDLWLESEDEGDCQLSGRLVIDGKPAEGWLASLDRETSEAVGPQAFVEPGAFRLAVDEPGTYRLNLRPDTTDPSAMLVILDPVELYQGTSFWSLELKTGELEGTLGAADGEDGLVFYRWERGALQCLAPLVPSEGGRFRCARVPAGHGALVRCDPILPIEQQRPVVLRELMIEAGKTTSVEL